MYSERDVVHDIYFCYSGVAGLVVRALDNIIYCTVEEGDFLGIVDLVPTKDQINTSTIDMMVHKRKFTLQCFSKAVEFFSLSLDQLGVIKEDFPEIFEELFFNALTNFKKLKYLR